jgi:hypothetical protein
VMLVALGYSAAHAREAGPVELGAASMASLATPAPSTLVAPAATKLAAATEKPAEEPKKPAFTLPSAARAYLASAYPQAKITAIVKATSTVANDPTSYVVNVVQRQKTLHLSFDATGRFLGEKKGVFSFKGPAGFFTNEPTKLVGARPTTSQPAPASPAQGGPDPLCYLDGQVITMAQFKALDVTSIYHTYFFEGEQARRAASEKGYSSIMVVTTKANKNTPSVVEFNQRMERLYAPPFQASSPSLTTSLPADALYYLDGQPSTKQAVEQLVVKNIANIEVVSDQARIHRIPGLSDSPATSVVLVTTKANSNVPAVQDFVNKADLASAYTFRPVGANVLVPAALAYITSHYPNARLNEVQEQKQKTTGAVKYQVQLINGKRPFFVYFSPQGEFLGE